MNDPLSGWLLPSTMFGLMFGMGLALTPADFRRVLQVPGPVIVGTFLQLLAVPLVGLALVFAYNLSPLLAVGLMITAACPGGMGSNLFIYYAGANTALSITLTAVATTVSLFTLPLWIGVVQGLRDASSSAVTVPVLDMVIELGGLTVLPVIVGMVTRGLYEPATKLERPVTLASVLGLVGVTVADSMSRPRLPVEAFAEMAAPVAWLAVAAMLIGYLVPRALGHSRADAVTISVELCVRNILLGIVVAAMSFPEFEPNIPLFLYSGFMVPPAFLVIFLFRRAERRAGRLSR